MATNQVMFSELALGDIFSVITYSKELKNKLFVKVMRPGGKYGAMPIDDYNWLSANPSALIIGDYHIETDCKHWHCCREDDIKTINARKETTPKEETKLVGLYNHDIGKKTIEVLKVTAEQLKVIYYMYNHGWLDFDNIIENPVPEVTDLTK